MPSLCCFWCPASDFQEREPGEKCPTCSRDFQAPLQSPPTRVRTFRITEPLSRGFYSAAYRAEQESLRRTVVLKIVPVAVYEHFKKDWEHECAEHASIAEGTPFVANIREQFTDTIEIDGTPLECHVAVLDNIVGPTLAHVLETPAGHGLTPRMAAQIAGDLYEILHIFIQRGRNHNDLHAGNIIIQQLGGQTLRSGAIESAVRAVAIDLGSVLDATRSGDHGGRVLGDQHQIAKHLSILANAVRSDDVSDLDHRVAGALRGLAEHLAPALDAQRIMTVDDALQAIRASMSAIDEPWRQALSLHRFGDAYNAQALESWHVPELWFDPENKWLQKTTVRGPQVITGMRGCGKTMLLRALHFHARAVAGRGSTQAAFRTDPFVGVYASCQKLLNPQDHRSATTAGVSRPFERLYVAYLRDAIQVLRHVRSIDTSALLGTLDVLLRGALVPLELEEHPDGNTGEAGFTQFLTELQFGLSDGVASCRLKMAPAEAFGYLADVIRAASPTLADKYVLFLLDDVSTRYLDHDVVREVISQLLFQHPRCGFRITTEAQALHRVLLSPGGSAPADPLRDYEEFNLGNEVYRLLQEGSTQRNMEFISEILRRRGRQFQDELYRREPRELLGDVHLEEIAKEIASSTSTSADRKRVYRGLRAVQAVCVGDIGDVVKLYEKILQKAKVHEMTVPPQRQNDCFLEHSAGLMHFLNRRDQHKKGLALAFAQAAGELLQRSATSERLRQYTKLYVRVDAGPDFEWVATTLLSLLDAGVFVYDGGVPRTKTRDDDPVLQFKLSYRKMLGLASFIGLADRDRFELSGETLKTWLQRPDLAKDILVESESKRKTRSEPPEDEPVAEDLQESASDVTGVAPEPSPKPPADSAQRRRKSPSIRPSQLDLAIPLESGPIDSVFAPSLGVSANPCSLSSLSDGRQTLVLAAGFEERALVSAERCIREIRPKDIVLVEYGDDQGEQIKTLVRNTGVQVHKIRNFDELPDTLVDSENVVIDASGLSKPFLFVAARDVLARLHRVTVVHTLAQRYYPTNEDLRAAGVTGEEGGVALFQSLEHVLVGEAPPYRLIPVHHEPAEPERWRALIASASPKNDRLLHLLDERSYDAARILVPPPTSERRRVTRAAAELAASAADSNVGLTEMDTNDLSGALGISESVYNDLYYGSGANIEIGLTGSKIHAVAFAALAAAGRISAAWYVSPQSLDRNRFTRGVGETRCFSVTWNLDRS